MIFAKLIELIEANAERLTGDVAHALVTDQRTWSFRRVPRKELEERIFEIYRHLGDWIGEPDDARVQAEFEAWGHRRFGQGMQLSEIVCAVIILKQHLRRYIRDHGLVDAASPRADSEYVLPMHLYGLQELNARVGEFFDRALYYLALGYEAEARAGGAARGTHAPGA
jgi:hypothetical protein